jgi:hypothetical protein
MKRLCLLVVPLALLVGPLSAATRTPKNVPLEVALNLADFVCVGKVAETAAPREEKLTLPDGKSDPAQYQWYKVEVERVLKADKNGSTTRPGKATIELYTPAVKAPPPPPRGAKAPTQPAGTLTVGDKCVLLLARLPKREVYYLASKDDCSDVKELDRIEAGLDLDRWPWGRAENGLRIAIIPQPDMTVAAPNKPVKCAALVALRNTSSKNIGVSLYPWDKPLVIEAADATRKVSQDFNDHYFWVNLPPWGSTYAKILKPGDMLFLGPDGATLEAVPFEMKLTPGKWKFTAQYRNTRDATDEQGDFVWKGKTQSLAVEMEIPKESPAGGP